MVIFTLRGLKASGRQRASSRAGPGPGGSLPGGPSERRRGRTVGHHGLGARIRPHNSGDYETAIVAVQEILTPFEVYDYDGTTCAAHYGRIRSELQRAGQTIGAMDLLIAAHALALAATIVTNNLPHFQRISGLSVTRWP